MKDFKVSVIIPAYNAGKYLRKAVEAAVSQDEVGEVVLIEDKSPDNTYEICIELSKEFEKVSLYQHPDRGNHGCGASRNLGLKYAKFPFVTFADADNYLLPGRFKIDREVFTNNPSVDGIYHAEGIHYYSRKSEEVFKKNVSLELLTFTGKVSPAEVFDVLIGNHSVTGSWGIDSITIRKDFVQGLGGFNTNLKLQQDVDLFIKMAAVGNFVSGSLTSPLSIRGVHDEMRSTDVQLQNKYRDERWKSLSKWIRRNPSVSKIKRKVFRIKYKEYLISSKPKLGASFVFAHRIILEPRIVLKQYGYFDLTTYNLFGKGRIVVTLISLKNRIFKRKVRTSR